jgi:hypothetical protein
MRTLLLATAVTFAGCGHLHDSKTVCPEYRDIRCVAGVDCSYDRARGCEVCRCAPLPTSGALLPPADAPK